MSYWSGFLSWSGLFGYWSNFLGRGSFLSWSGLLGYWSYFLGRGSFLSWSGLFSYWSYFLGWSWLGGLNWNYVLDGLYGLSGGSLSLLLNVVLDWDQWGDLVDIDTTVAQEEE